MNTSALRQLYHILSLFPGSAKVDPEIFDIMDMTTQTDEEPDYDNIQVMLEDLSAAGCIEEIDEGMVILVEHDLTRFMMLYNMYMNASTTTTVATQNDSNVGAPVVKPDEVNDEENQDESEEDESEEDEEEQVNYPRTASKKMPVAATGSMFKSVKVARPPQTMPAMPNAVAVMPQAQTQAMRMINIKSFTDPSITYQVDVNNATCSCPSFKYHGPYCCKHMEEIIDNCGNYGLNGGNDVQAMKNLASR